MKTCTRFLICILITLLVATSALAQYGASVQGTVTDKSGAMVPNAIVTVTNEATGIVSKTKTSDAGLYRVGALPPGMYTVAVEAANIGNYSAKNVEVKAETVRGFNIVLAITGTKETVTVTGEVAGIQTENANISGTISQQQVDRLPQFNRDPYELVRLAPGVFGDGARSASGGSTFFPNSPGPQEGSNNGIFNVENFVQVTANGQRASGNNFTIDGTSVNSLTWGGSAIITPNAESIQEMTVVSSTYTAEEGRNSGAQVKVISKSGTNQLHGSAFFKYDEPGLNARNKHFGQKVNYKGRGYGGSIGGPIFKNKLFFFFSYEGNRVNDLSYSDPRYIETSQFRQAIIARSPNSVIGKMMNASGVAPNVVQVLTPSCADFAGQGYPAGACQVVAGGIDVGSPTLAYGQYVDAFPMTAGGGLDGIADVQRVVIGSPSSSKGHQYNLRVDYNLTSSDLVAFSSYYVPRSDQKYIKDARANQAMDFRPRNRYGAILWNHIFSPTLLNEFRFNATRFFYDEYATNSDLQWGLPYVEVETIPGSRIQFGPEQGTNAPGRFAQNQFELRETLSKTLSRHGLKFGFGYAINQDNNNYEFGAQRPVFVFHGLWNLANGTPIYEGINADPRTGAPTDDHKYFRQNDWSGFVQDDIKVAHNFTVNIGLRYEYFAPLSEKYDRLGNLVLGTGANPLQTASLKVGSPLYPADRNNFAPRIGFAWSPSRLHDTTVVRGGFGMSYNRVTDTMTAISRVNPPYLYRYGICCAMSAADLAANSWGMPAFGNGQIAMDSVIGSNYTSILNYAANPVLTNNFDPTTGLPLTGAIEIWGAPQSNRTPYVWNYSMEIERQLPWHMTGTIGYAGSESKKLLRIVNENNIYAANPRFFAVYFPTTDGIGKYNALNASLNRRFAQGLQFYAKYRWSKSLDTVSGEGAGGQTNQFFPPNQTWDYGPSDFDATHSFTITTLYDLPIFRNRNDFVGKALGGWHVDGTFQFHSGFPWSAKVGNCTPVPSGNNICPSLVNAYKGGATPGTDYSTDTFLKTGGNFPLGGASYFTWGSGSPPFVGRNSFRGPRYSVFDLSLAKTTRVPWWGSENAKIDFRANFFNLFNKLNLKPFGYFDDSTFADRSGFGKAQSALAGRVINFQMRFTF